MAKWSFSALIGIVGLALPASGADVNEDGRIDEEDALVMSYVYASAERVGDGRTGGLGDLLLSWAISDPDRRRLPI